MHMRDKEKIELARLNLQTVTENYKIIKSAIMPEEIKTFIKKNMDIIRDLTN